MIKTNVNKTKNLKLKCSNVLYPLRKANSKGYPIINMDKNKLRFRNKTALSYFSIKLINANELITIEIQVINISNMLKSLNNPRIENVDIIKRNKLVTTAK
jgi:hypothetical protein